jgi:hypothetical protein
VVLGDVIESACYNEEGEKEEEYFGSPSEQLRKRADCHEVVVIQIQEVLFIQRVTRQYSTDT